MTLKQEFMKYQKLELMKTRVWIFFGVYCCLITYLSHQPGDPSIVPPFPHFDKLVHFIEYFLFAILLQRALYVQSPQKRAESPKSIFMIVLACTAVFAAFDEIHQYFIPFRTMDILDWIADMLGASFGLIIFQAARPKYVNDESYTMPKPR